MRTCARVVLAVVMSALTMGAAASGQKDYGPLLVPMDKGGGLVVVETHMQWIMLQKVVAPRKMTYAQAEKYAKACTVGGYRDWRIPTLRELEHMAYIAKANPSAFTVRSGEYYSSTVSPEGFTAAVHVVGIYPANLGKEGKKFTETYINGSRSYPFYVWLTRTEDKPPLTVPQ